MGAEVIGVATVPGRSSRMNHDKSNQVRVVISAYNIVELHARDRPQEQMSKCYSILLGIFYETPP